METEAEFTHQPPQAYADQGAAVREAWALQGRPDDDTPLLSLTHFGVFQRSSLGAEVALTLPQPDYKRVCKEDKLTIFLLILLEKLFLKHWFVKTWYYINRYKYEAYIC